MTINENANPEPNAFRITARLIIGLGVLMVGTLLTLDNIDLIEAGRIIDWWPAALILAGLVRLFDPTAGKTGSVVLVIFGSALLLDSLDVGNIDWQDFIPLGIAVIGGKLVWDALGRRPTAAASMADPSSSVNAFALMAGVRRQSTSHEFHGGDASAIMGGVELDLRNAQIKDGEEAAIDAFAFWGGVEIMVPENWRVVGKVMPLMGGFEDKTTNKTGTGPVLIVRGTAIMGAVEVKN